MQRANRQNGNGLIYLRTNSSKYKDRNSPFLFKPCMLWIGHAGKQAVTESSHLAGGEAAEERVNRL
jgi:hypothetical protein